MYEGYVLGAATQRAMPNGLRASMWRQRRRVVPSTVVRQRPRRLSEVLVSTIVAIVAFSFGVAVTWLLQQRRHDIGHHLDDVDRSGAAARFRQLQDELDGLHGRHDALLERHADLVAGWNRVYDWYHDVAKHEYHSMEQDLSDALGRLQAAEERADLSDRERVTELEEQRLRLEAEHLDLLERERQAVSEAATRELDAVRLELSHKTRESDAIRDELAEATMRWHESSSALRQAESAIEELRQDHRGTRY